MDDAQRIAINKRLRAYRVRTQNAGTKRYEKTRKGFLVRLYRNMQSRITGVQASKHHLYKGKALLSREEFYEWSLTSSEFVRLFTIWEESSYNRRLTPSVDRIDSSEGYEVENMEWVPFHENCRRGAVSRHSKKPCPLENA